MRRLFLAAVIVALASGGCATAKAKPRIEPAPLEVPAPPPRVIVPPGPEPVKPQATPSPEQKPAGRTASLKPEPKTEAARPPDPPPAAATVPPPTTAPPAAKLQQALPATQDEMRRQVQDHLKQARADLKRVNYNALNADAKSQYDTAAQFITQAEQALTEGNFVFAVKVAEKAAGLAASLLGR